MTLSELAQHLIPVTAGAALLGGSAAIVSNKVDVAVLDQRVTNVETLNDNVVELKEELLVTRLELARLGHTNPKEEDTNP